LPIYRDNDVVAGYVHSIPISRAAFEANYILLSATFAAVYNQGLGEMAGPRVAELILKDVAKARGMDATPLLDEIKRLSCLIQPGANGWETIPLHEAISRKQIDEDDVAEVMGALVFFTCAWGTMPRQRAKDILPGAARMWGAEMSSLLPTEWIASLQTSTETASSGATALPLAAAPTLAGTTIMVDGNPTS
jgi:hypothetical protein